MPAPEEPAPIAPLDPADAATRAEVDDLLERAERASAHPPLAEASLLARAGAGRDSAGLVLRRDGATTGYAQLVWRDGATSVEIVLDPTRPEERGVRRTLLERAVAMARERGADEIRYWVVRHGPGDGAEAEALGFAVERDLLQMTVPLPITAERRALGEGFTLRAFRPGLDEAEWLEVNNRAFATHPEQSRWDAQTLAARQGSDWFRPDGFVVCEHDGRMAGSCWTKVHQHRTPATGEIYVISVDPDFQGHGLGRALTVAGLDWLAGVVSVGMLYVEESNRAAVELYRSLGFDVDHVDRCYLLAAPGL